MPPPRGTSVGVNAASFATAAHCKVSAIATQRPAADPNDARHTVENQQYWYPGNAQPPVYQILGQRYTEKAEMFAGLFRYLADDDGNVRLNGNPLFTFSDGKKELLFEGTEQAFTWPVET